MNITDDGCFLQEEKTGITMISSSCGCRWKGYGGGVTDNLVDRFGLSQVSWYPGGKEMLQVHSTTHVIQEKMGEKTGWV